MINGTLTFKKLIDWINEQFIKFEITDYKVVEIARTRYRSQEYESGACKLHIYFECISLPKDSLMKRGYFICFYSLKELKHALSDGYELYLSSKSMRLFLLSNLELDLRKVDKKQTA